MNLHCATSVVVFEVEIVYVFLMLLSCCCTSSLLSACHSCQNESSGLNEIVNDAVTSMLLVHSVIVLHSICAQYINHVVRMQDLWYRARIALAGWCAVRNGDWVGQCWNELQSGTPYCSWSNCLHTGHTLSCSFCALTSSWPTCSETLSSVVN